eukprot:723536-Pleurochrysis_carterae.AAC.1
MLDKSILHVGQSAKPRGGGVCVSRPQRTHSGGCHTRTHAFYACIRACGSSTESSLVLSWLTVAIHLSVYARCTGVTTPTRSTTTKSKPNDPPTMPSRRNATATASKKTKATNKSTVSKTCQSTTAANLILDAQTTIGYDFAVSKKSILFAPTGASKTVIAYCAALCDASLHCREYDLTDLSKCLVIFCAEKAISEQHQRIFRGVCGVEQN